MERQSFGYISVLPVVVITIFVIIIFPHENLACLGTRRQYYIAEVPSSTCPPSNKTTTPNYRGIEIVSNLRIRTTTEFITAPKPTKVTKIIAKSSPEPADIFTEIYRRTQAITIRTTTPKPTTMRPIRTPGTTPKPQTRSTAVEYYEPVFTDDPEPPTTKPPIKMTRTTTTTTLRIKTGPPLNNRATMTTTRNYEPIRRTYNIRPESCFACGTIPAFANSIDASQLRAAPDELPWQAHLMVTTATGLTRTCGGALVANNFTVLTSASCFDGVANVAKISVILGETNRNRDNEPDRRVTRVLKVLKHKLHKQAGDMYDIALVKTEEVAYSDAIMPACLPDVCRPINNAERCITSGWKTTSDCLSPGSQQLQKAVTRLVQDYNQCGRAVKEQNADLNTAQLVCGQIADPERNGYCHADTGGPLVCRPQGEDRFTLEGVLAFHTGCKEGNNNLDVYYRVCEFADWIDDALYGAAALRDDEFTSHFPH